MANSMVKWVKKNPLMAIGLGAGMAYIANSYGAFSGLGKAGMLGDEDDDMFRKTGWTGKHAYGTPEPIHPMPSGPKIRYDLDFHEAPLMTDPIYENAKRPRDASQFQPASVRNMNMETTVALETSVFAGIDHTNTF